MAELTVGMTYGTALFQVAVETGKRDLILEEAESILEILKKEPDLQAFINTPVVAKEEKKKVLGAVFEGRISEELLNFLYILVDKSRTLHFQRSIKVYKELLNKEDGKLYGKILSVTPLSPERLQKFEEETAHLLRQQVKLENEIDTSLIGGIKIFIDGKIIDASIRKRIDDLAGVIM